MLQVNRIPRELIYFRKALAALLAFYYLSLIPRFHDFFGNEGWINKKLWPYSFSIFNSIDAFEIRWIALFLIFLLLWFLFAGKINRIGLLVLYLLNLSFYHWNPLILHEPQHLTNLFLLSFFFLPLNDKYSYDPWIKNLLIIFLGVYYLLAGLKKLPDPHFIDGSALESIVAWPTMAKNIDLNVFLVKHLIWPIRLTNYLILIFEITFIALIFSRLRIYYLAFGLFLHALIFITMDVGNLSFVMLVWYLLLFDADTLNRAERIKYKFTMMICKFPFFTKKD